VEGIGVAADPADDVGRRSWVVSTNARGDYRIRLRPGRYSMHLSNVSGLRSRIPAIDLDTIQVTDRVTRFNYQYGGSKVTGTIAGPKGGVSSGVIIAHGTERAGVHVVVMARIKDGKYSFFVAPGKYRLESDSLPTGLPKFEGQELTVSGDTTIHLEATGHYVTGRVALGAKEPLVGARVQAWGEVAGVSRSSEVATGGDGKYGMYLPSGRYGVTVWPARSQRFISTKAIECVVDDDEHFDIDMSGVEWTGTVRDLLTGEPIDSVAVNACYVRFNGCFAEDVTHSGGEFRLVLGRSGGPYSIRVTRKDDGALLLKSPDVFATEDTTFILEASQPPDSKGE
jgi:hypothetical protein